MKIYKSFFRRVSLCVVLLGTALITLNFKNVTIKKNFEQLKISDTDVVVIDTTEFSISMPKNWKHFVKESQTFKILFLMAPRVDNFSPNLNILIEDTHGLSQDEYMKTSDENMKNGGIVKDGGGDFVVNDYHGKYLTSILNYQGHDIALKTYIFIKNGHAYVLTGSCLISQQNGYRPIFDKVVETFKIK